MLFFVLKNRSVLEKSLILISPGLDFPGEMLCPYPFIIEDGPTSLGPGICLWVDVQFTSAKKIYPCHFYRNPIFV